MNYAKDFSTKKMMQDIEEKIQSYLSEEDKPVEPKGMLERKNSTNEIDGDSVVADSLADLITKASDNKAKRYRGMNFKAERPRSSPEEINEFLANMKEVNRIAPGFYYDKDDRNNPMNFSGSIVKEDRQTDALIDIAETALEQPVEIPTLDIAEAIEQDQVEQQDTSTLKGSQAGLMAKPVQKDLISGADKKGEKASFSNQKLTVQYLEDNFVDTYLTEHEGTTAHDSLEGGIRTGAYGVKNIPKGMSRSDYSSDAEFAAAVSLHHYQKVQGKYNTLDKSKLWKSFPPSAQMAILDLQFNVGTVGQTPTKTNLKDSLENTLEFVGMTAKDGTKGSLMSLAKRRALNWNKVTGDSSNLTPIKTIKQIPTSSGGTRFEFIDKDDNIVYDFSNGRTPIKLDSKGNTTTLTATREETL